MPPDLQSFALRIFSTNGGVTAGVAGAGSRPRSEVAARGPNMLEGAPSSPRRAGPCESLLRECHRSLPMKLPTD